MATLLSDAQATSLGSEKDRINRVKGLYLRKSSDGAGLFHLRYSNGDSLNANSNERGQYGS